MTAAQAQARLSHLDWLEAEAISSEARDLASVVRETLIAGRPCTARSDVLACFGFRPPGEH